jgi:hypothetical protein
MPRKGEGEMTAGHGMTAMLIRGLFFGVNLLTLAGFALMGISLALNRQQRIRAPTAFALMGAGTGLLVLGLYLAPPPTPG